MNVARKIAIERLGHGIPKLRGVPGKQQQKLDKLAVQLKKALMHVSPSDGVRALVRYDFLIGHKRRARGFPVATSSVFGRRGA